MVRNLGSVITLHPLLCLYPTQRGYHQRHFNPADFQGELFCEQPHNKIYDFNGYVYVVYVYVLMVVLQPLPPSSHRVEPDGTRVGVNRNNLLLRGCVLRNTSRVAGIVVYAGNINIYLICLTLYTHRKQLNPIHPIVPI